MKITKPYGESNRHVVSINGITLVFDSAQICELDYVHLYKSGNYICAIYKPEIANDFLHECDRMDISVEYEAKK